MTGLPAFNYPEFHRVTKALRDQGYQVYNPAEYPHDGALVDFPLRAAFAEYTRFICLEACTIVLLPGWQNSKGVAAELSLARVLGLEVVEWSTWGHCAPATSPAP